MNMLEPSLTSTPPMGGASEPLLKQSPKRQPTPDNNATTTTDSSVLRPNKRRKKRCVSWKEKQLAMLTGPDVCDAFDDRDVWYSRQDYNDFLEDRLRTVRKLRASGGDEGALDANSDSLRGLEPFQTALEHQAMNSKQRFHQTTIILEQMRQSRLGIRDPGRYLMLVAPQSEFALRRAQELAALDEHEVYRKVCRRTSLLTTGSNLTSSNGAALSLSLSDRIRRLQEWNARRLYEIYQVSSDDTSSTSGEANQMSRFRIRRDSLFGSSLAGTGSRLADLAPSRFNIRRDSLGHATSNR